MPGDGHIHHHCLRKLQAAKKETCDLCKTSWKAEEGVSPLQPVGEDSVPATQDNLVPTKQGKKRQSNGRALDDSGVADEDDDEEDEEVDDTVEEEGRRRGQARRKTRREEVADDDEDDTQEQTQDTTRDQSQETVRPARVSVPCNDGIYRR